MKSKTIHTTVKDYVEANGIRLAELARALGLTPQNLQVKKRGNWPMIVTGQKVVFVNPNPNRPGDERHHKLKGAKWLEK